jgi:hypothetical protein
VQQHRAHTHGRTHTRKCSNTGQTHTRTRTNTHDLPHDTHDLLHDLTQVKELESVAGATSLAGASSLAGAIGQRRHHGPVPSSAYSDEELGKVYIYRERERERERGGRERETERGRRPFGKLSALRRKLRGRCVCVERERKRARD